ncbi:MAG: hypothetical protein ACTSWI_02705 [Alphaproteobacteria bacterium]
MEAASTLTKNTATETGPQTIVLDLDDTSLSTNVLHELALVYVKQNPLRLFRS